MEDHPEESFLTWPCKSMTATDPSIVAAGVLVIAESDPFAVRRNLGLADPVDPVEQTFRPGIQGANDGFQERNEPRPCSRHRRPNRHPARCRVLRAGLPPLVERGPRFRLRHSPTEIFVEPDRQLAALGDGKQRGVLQSQLHAPVSSVRAM